jgi:tripartite-type tricarboxylate transporter receptor subunit TctC
MTEVWGRQVIVDHPPGAGNTLAASIVAKAAPDGYALLVCTISETIAPALYKKFFPIY